MSTSLVVYGYRKGRTLCTFFSVLNQQSRTPRLLCKTYKWNHKNLVSDLFYESYRNNLVIQWLSVFIVFLYHHSARCLYGIREFTVPSDGDPLGPALRVVVRTIYGRGLSVYKYWYDKCHHFFPLPYLKVIGNWPIYKVVHYRCLYGLNPEVYFFDKTYTDTYTYVPYINFIICSKYLH